MIGMIWTFKTSYFMTTPNVDGGGSEQMMERTRSVADLARRPARR
jgi:hypothetical protein